MLFKQSEKLHLLLNCDRLEFIVTYHELTTY